MSFYKSSTTKNSSARISKCGLFGRALIALSLLCGLAAQANAVCYVNGGATGKNDGSSWTDAYTNPQFALLNSACNEIWVARGVYKPTLGTDQTVPFEIGPGIAMYGGFAGGETSRDVRDPTRYVTVLSGDIDGNDANAGTTGIDLTSGDIRGSNSFHVVDFPGQSVSPITSTTVLNGFTITGGDASGSGGTGLGGGALCNGDGEGNDCSPSLGLDIFSGNRAANAGGAFYGDGREGGSSGPSLTDVVFVGNGAATGGAMYITSTTDASDIQGVSTPTLFNVTFDRNSASLAGGAMYNDAEGGGLLLPKLEKVTFKGNNVMGNGHLGGAVYNIARGGAVNPTFKNVTFFENTASFGGAITNDTRTAGDISAQALNVTFESNAADEGGAIYNVGGSEFHLRNAILWNDQANSAHTFDEILNDSASNIAVDYGVVSHDCPAATGVSCSVIYTSDPKLGLLVNNGGFTETLLPATGSSAIDRGDDTNCPADDQRGTARPQGPHCDIGAVEVIPIPPPIAQPLNITIPENTTGNITFAATDSNPGGPFSFTYIILTRPNHGTPSAVSGGAVTFTPDSNYTGPDSFTYAATDTNGTSAPATVTIQVIATPPVADPKNISVPHNTSRDVTLTASDSNAGGPFSYTFAVVTPTTHGTVTLAGDVATYTPVTNYTGPDSFTYTATDVNGISLPALVTIQVAPAPPVAAPRAIVMPFNTSKSVTFGATDSNLGGPFAYTFAVASAPTHGTLGLVEGDIILYTPTHGYSGPDAFTYTVTDKNGVSVPATVTITVLPPGGGGGPTGGTTAIPTLSTWSLLTLAGLIGLTFVRRKRNT